MLKQIRNHILDPQVVILWGAALVVIAIILYWGAALAPFLTAVVVAYILEGMIRRLEEARMPRPVAVSIVYSLFIAVVVSLFVWLGPLLVEQLSALVAALPDMAGKLQRMIMDLHSRYAAELPPQFIQDVIPRITNEVESIARKLVTYLLVRLPSLLSLLLYLFLVPFLVLFFLKDKRKILGWIGQFIPRRRDLLNTIVADIDRQLGRFFRGKLWEMIIISIASVAALLILDLRFAVLLGLISGVSVLVPYVGVMLATVPIVLVAFFQFGWDPGFWYVVGSFTVIQVIDGNFLMPILVGDMIEIHPTAIIFAMLVCAYSWGFVGVLLALPLAIAVKSILKLVLPYLAQREDDVNRPASGDQA